MMTFDDELQRLYGELRDERATDRRDCVEPEALAALVEERLSESERLRLLRHVSACAECDADLRLVWSAADAGRRASRRRFPTLAIAASVAAILLGSVVVWQVLENDRSALRSADGEVSLVTPVERVQPAGAFDFVWRSVPGASRYELEILDGTGGLVFAGSTSDTILPLPDTLELAAGEYRWWVRAVRENGSRVRSRAVPFEITSP